MSIRRLLDLIDILALVLIGANIGLGFAQNNNMAIGGFTVALLFMCRARLLERRVRYLESDE